MSEVYYNMKPEIIKNRTVWVADKCECGENRVMVEEDKTIKCYNCGKEINKNRR